VAPDTRIDAETTVRVDLLNMRTRRMTRRAAIS
jgi:hypothetical protein